MALAAGYAIAETQAHLNLVGPLNPSYYGDMDTWRRVSVLAHQQSPTTRLWVRDDAAGENGCRTLLESWEVLSYSLSNGRRSGCILEGFQIVGLGTRHLLHIYCCKGIGSGHQLSRLHDV